MQFKTDENLPLEVTELLRSAGYDAMSVLEQGMGGKSDPYLVDICTEENRVLITLDTDFADIRAYLKLPVMWFYDFHVKTSKA